MKNLINTRWVFDQDPVLNSILGFNINFTSNGHEYSKLTVEQAMNPNYELKYYQKDSDVVDYPYHTGNGWNKDFKNDKSITITGGVDSQSEDLYAFLRANATQEMLTKNVVLNKDNVDLFPRTKASLLVEDDGETPWTGGTNVEANNGKPTTATLNTLEVNGVNYLLPSGSGKLIDFTIDGTTYSAIENMTFEDWVNSKLNVNGFVVSGNYIQNKEKTAFIDNVVKDMPIEAQAYTLIVKFYIDLISYKAPLNTTWETWVNSVNNTGGFKVKPEENDIFTSDFSKVIKGASKGGLIESKKYETWIKPKAIILGVSGEAQSNSKLTRTDGAIGLNVVVPESGVIQSDFDNVAPYSDITEVTDSKGNKFVRIPKFYTQYTIESDGTKTTKICTVKLDETWKLNPCFKNENGQELDYIDVGKYQASGSSSLAKSVSGESPLVNITRDNLATACKNNGNGYQQFDIWTHEMLATLFKIEFATTNSQSVMYGYLNSNPSAIASGNCDSLGVNKSGSNGSNTDGKRPMTYRGIENLYGNVYQWVDGINFQDGNIFVNEKPSTYKSDTFTGDYKKVGYQKIQQDGFPSKMGYDEAKPFIAFPIELKGSNSTYYCDQYYYNSGNRVLYFGSDWYSGLSGGLWSLRSYGGSGGTSSDRGGRLIRKAI